MAVGGRRCSGTDHDHQSPEEDEEASDDDAEEDRDPVGRPPNLLVGSFLGVTRLGVCRGGREDLPEVGVATVGPASSGSRFVFWFLADRDLDFFP